MIRHLPPINTLNQASPRSAMRRSRGPANFAAVVRDAAANPTPARSAGTRPVVTTRTAALTAAAATPAPRSSARANVTAPAPRVPDLGPEAASLTPMATLSAAFESLGLNASDLQLTESRTTVFYPGGSYENHLITATYPDGRTESVSVPLMMRNPSVAVADLLRPLGIYI